jgi:hypothetical protein
MRSPETESGADVNEIFPLTAGLVAGILLGGLAPRLRWRYAVVVAVVVGVLATVISGEYAVSWGFLLFDIPLAALATMLGLTMSRAVRLKAGELLGSTRASEPEGGPQSGA